MHLKKCKKIHLLVAQIIGGIYIPALISKYHIVVQNLLP